ncbi:MAG: hypothetical protein AABY22_21455, partial [Nanoarchaeota archaeon]
LHREKSGGYLTYKFYLGNHKYFRIKIHRLVALVFIPNPNNLPYINHKNMVVNDNNVDNLEWTTHAQNIKHAFKNKYNALNYNKGERNNSNKLSCDDIIKIREMYIKGQFTHKQIANIYNVNRSTITSAISGKNWKELIRK